jgi:hypothetical protein
VTRSDVLHLANCCSPANREDSTGSNKLGEAVGELGSGLSGPDLELSHEKKDWVSVRFPQGSLKKLVSTSALYRGTKECYFSISARREESKGCSPLSENNRGGEVRVGVEVDKN